MVVVTENGDYNDDGKDDHDDGNNDYDNAYNDKRMML